MDHEEIKEEGFLTRPPFTLPSSTRPREAKRMMTRGIRHEAGSEKFRPIARSNPEGLGGHAHFAWNGASF